MTLAVTAVALLIGGWLMARPFMGGRALAWPEEPADIRDDVTRAVSSLRDLEFARAAGTIDPADHARLRARIEANALAPAPAPAPAGAPVRTLAIAALLSGIAAVLVVTALPREVGDRAPGTTITGTVPDVGSTIAELEARVAANPADIPTQLALADAYRAAGRVSESAQTYRTVLEMDDENIPALNGLGLILFQAGSIEGALAASDRVLSLRPRDADALFLRGLALYRTEDYAGAVEAWEVFLDVGEFHPAAPMVRPLYDDARSRLGR